MRVPVQASNATSRRMVHIVGLSSAADHEAGSFQQGLCEELAELLSARFVRLLRPVKGGPGGQYQVVAAFGQVLHGAIDAARQSAIVDLRIGTSILADTIRLRSFLHVQRAAKDPRFQSMVRGGLPGSLSLAWLVLGRFST